MPKPTPYTRREFLGTSLAMVATTAAVPLFVQRSAFALDAEKRGSAVSSKPGVPDERILVIVQLSGGNDGLNTVVPYGNRDYYAARPTIAIPEKEVITIVPGTGLHPALRPIGEMMGRGLASVVVGVGYPNPNRSHFSSMDIWHTADPENGTNSGYGWIGKSMDLLREKAGGKVDPTACICVGRDSPLATNGRNVKPVAFEQANTFRWIGPSVHPSLAGPYNTINRAGMIGMRDGVPRPASTGVAGASEAVGAGDQAAFVMQTALDAQVTSDKLRGAVDKPTSTIFPQNNKLADQLRMVSQFIRAGTKTRVFYVTLGGFDTHANQSFTQQRLLAEFAAAISSFYAELKAIGQQERVLTMAFSEFGRRVEQNASGGTDHGTAGPMFFFGPSIRPGLIGKYPDLKELDNGDLIHTADFRCVYAAVLDGWLKLNSEKVLGNGFKQAAILKA